MINNPNLINKKRPYIVVSMSGGIDSSVTAMLLKKMGYHVEGIFMKNWEEDDTLNFCNSKQDLSDAHDICDILRIKLHTVNFSNAYWDNVFNFFIKEYKTGRTPNPDILCNKKIKFKVCLDYIKSLGADLLATGHYAKINFFNGNFILKKASDIKKDQTYFLYTLNQQQLKSIIFPLGNYNKNTIYKLAQISKFPNNNKKNSTGICFIGKRKFKNFLQKYLPPKQGNIININNDIIGKHDGLMYYTIGQRYGLNIGGMKNSSGDPWYVINKDLSSNTLTVVQGKNHPLLFKSCANISKLHWISQLTQKIKYGYLKCWAKIRYQQSEQPCIISVLDNKYKVTFQNKQKSITPGQSIVFYNNKTCIGGAIIDSFD